MNGLWVAGVNRTTRHLFSVGSFVRRNESRSEGVQISDQSDSSISFIFSNNHVQRSDIHGHPRLHHLTAAADDEDDDDDDSTD